MSYFITQRTTPRAIVEFSDLLNLGQYERREFPAGVGGDAIGFKDNALYCAGGADGAQKLWVFPDARDLVRYTEYSFPSSIVRIVGIAFVGDDMWLMEARWRTAADRLLKYTGSLDNLSDGSWATTRSVSSTNSNSLRFIGLTAGKFGTRDEQSIVSVAYVANSPATRRYHDYSNLAATIRVTTKIVPAGFNGLPIGIGAINGRLVIADSSRYLWESKDPLVSSPTFTKHGPYTASLTDVQGFATGDIDPLADTGVAPDPAFASLPYVGRARITGPVTLGRGSPLGQTRRISEVTVGLFRSAGGIIRQAGQREAGDPSPLAEPGPDDPFGAQGYRVFTGEVEATLHPLGTDPTSTIQIEQHDQTDLEVTYLSMDTESED